jgi:hypothetical protein
MLEILENTIAILIGDATLTAIVPANNILTGPVDIVTESQPNLTLPQINIFTISDVSRSVPLDTRDTMIQIDIWSKNSMLEVLTAYERIVYLLNYYSGNENTAHIFWQRLGGAVDQFESDRRIWHRAVTYTVWSIK